MIGACFGMAQGRSSRCEVFRSADSSGGSSSLIGLLLLLFGSSLFVDEIVFGDEL